MLKCCKAVQCLTRCARFCNADFGPGEAVRLRKQPRPPSGAQFSHSQQLQTLIIMQKKRFIVHLNVFIRVTICFGRWWLTISGNWGLFCFLLSAGVQLFQERMLVMLGREDEHSLHPVLMMPSYKCHVWEGIYKPTAPRDPFTVRVVMGFHITCEAVGVYRFPRPPWETLTDPVLLATL